MSQKYKFGFMFVRDPFQRALSGFYDKVKKQNYFKGQNWTINQFFQRLVRKSAQDEHFDSQSTLCDPCFLGINFLGRTETMNRDLDQLINLKTELHQKIKFNHQESNHNLTILKKTNYSSVDSTIRELDRNLMVQFIWKYRMDYLAFGYNPYHILSKLS